MEMQLEVEEEYKQFLDDIEEDGFIFGAYIDEAEYEGEYSHNSIGRAMELLENKIKEHLRENKPGEFIVYSDWSVHVIKKEKAEEMGMRKRLIESCIVRQ